jgi:3D (Asp-Asp-Asp) domain-containing protein
MKTGLLILSTSIILLTILMVNKLYPEEYSPKYFKQLSIIKNYNQTTTIIPDNKELFQKLENILEEYNNIEYYYYGGRQYIKLSNGLLQYNDELWKPITVTTTAYTWMDDGLNPKIGAGDGITSTGTNAIKTYGIATDPRALQYGTMVHIDDYGISTVDDTGGLPRQSYKKGIVHLDLRIPQLKFNNQWRSIKTCQTIARKHGIQKNRTVLIKIN